MALKTAAQALQDVRKMRRAIRARESTDPAEVAQILDTVLLEVIAIREATGGRIGKNAVRELRDLRSDMIAGHVDAGADSGAYMAKFSAVLDTLEKADHPGKLSREGGSNMSSGGSSIGGFSLSDVIPSPDSLISALITANPVLGYTTKIARDFFSSMGERAKGEQERVKTAIEEAKAKAQLLEEEIEATQDQGQKSDLTDKLEEINEEIHSLNKFLQEVWGDAPPEDSIEEQENTNDLLERVDSGIQEQIDMEEQSGRRNDLLERENELEGRGSGGLDDSVLPEDDGMLGLDALGGPMKLLAGLKIAAIGGILYSIYNFIDGIFGVADFLGKDQSDVTIKERIIYGVANVISTIGHTLAKPIDWIYQWLTGNDSLLGDKDDLTRFFYDGITWIVDQVTGFITSPIDYVKNLFGQGIENLIGFLPEEWAGKYGEDIKAIAGNVFDFFTMPLRMIQGILSEAFEFIQDPAGYAQSIKDKVSASIDSGIQFVQDTIQSVIDQAKAIISNIRDAITNMAENAMKKIKGFFGFGDDDDPKTGELTDEQKLDPTRNKTELDRIEKQARVIEYNSYDMEKENPELFDLQQNNAANMASTALGRDQAMTNKLIQSGVVKNPVIFNQNNTNVVNGGTTFKPGMDPYNGDPSWRRRAAEEGILRSAKGW